MNDTQKLESITEANVLDLVDNKKLVWLLKRIILNQEKRITDLEFEIANMNGKVEPEEDDAELLSYSLNSIK